MADEFRDKLQELHNSFVVCIEPLKQVDAERHKCLLEKIDQYEKGTESCYQNRLQCEIKNRELQEINRIRSQVVMEVSHELKAPISSAISLIKVVSQGYVEDEERQKDLLNRSIKRLDELLSLVRDMLDLSRTTLYPEELSKEEWDIVLLAQEIAEENRHFADDYVVSLSVDAQAYSMPVFANRAMIRRVIENLVSNGIKYNKPGGKVIIGLEKQDDGVLVSVYDTGQGMTEEEKEKLFELFYRGSKSKRDSREGTGLGLSLVKGIIEAHDTELIVESKPDEGSSFSFILHSPQ